jgi:hypothetical protein
VGLRAVLGPYAVEDHATLAVHGRDHRGLLRERRLAHEPPALEQVAIGKARGGLVVLVVIARHHLEHRVAPEIEQQALRRHPPGERMSRVEARVERRARAPELLRAAARNRVAYAQLELVDRELAGAAERHEGPALLSERLQRGYALGTDAALVLGRIGLTRPAALVADLS